MVRLASADKICFYFIKSPVYWDALILDSHRESQVGAYLLYSFVLMSSYDYFRWFLRHFYNQLYVLIDHRRYFLEKFIQSRQLTNYVFLASRALGFSTQTNGVVQMTTGESFQLKYRARIDQALFAGLTSVLWLIK